MTIVVAAPTAPVNVTELNTTGSDLAPSLSGDGLEIFFGRNNDIWRAVRPTVTSPFGAAGPGRTMIPSISQPRRSAIRRGFRSTRATSG